MEKKIMRQETNDFMTSLERAGLNPQLCDTPVAYDHRAVRCGQPMMPGDEDERDYCLMPRRMMGSATTRPSRASASTTTCASHGARCADTATTNCTRRLGGASG